jgi:hypothetical protein
MKILLLDKQTTSPTQLLENAVPNVRVRETEALAGCNCDRWGHPCPRCSDATVQPKPKVPISSAATTTWVNTWNT